MWKELNSFTGAYLLKLCHPWIVFFSTLLLYGSISLLVLPEYGHWSLSMFEVWVGFCLCSVSGNMNDGYCVLYLALPWWNLPKAWHTGYSIFVISDFCLLSSLIYSGSHCVGIVFSIKVLRKHRAFSDFYCFHSVFNLLFLFFCVLVPWFFSRGYLTWQ